jgi:hypothetical protein
VEHVCSGWDKVAKMLPGDGRVLCLQALEDTLSLVYSSLVSTEFFSSSLVSNCFFFLLCQLFFYLYWRGP